MSPLPDIDRDEYGKPRLPLKAAPLYAFGHLVRSTEQLLLDQFTRGLLSGTTHTCIGQELCQMSVVRALNDPEDAVLSNHRNHGHFLTYSGNFHGLVAEIMGREAGVCRGVGGSQHLAYRNFHSNGVQGGMTGISVGLALAMKRRGGSGIVACFLGDGSMGEGLVYESFNLASVWRVPLLFVVENNRIAQTTRTADTIGGSIAARGQAFGLPVWSVDDADPALFQRVEAIVAETRSAREPGLLVIDTMRLGPHSKGDDLREEAEMAQIRERDPLARLGGTLQPAARAEIERRNLEFIADVRTYCNSAGEARLDRTPSHAFSSRPATVRRQESAEASASKVTVRAALNLSLRKLLANHPEVILLGEDLHDPYGGAFKVTAGLSTDFEGRVISTPISEAAVVGASIGLALAGYRPIAEIMFADFVTLAMDQLYNHAVKLQALSPDMPLPLVIRTPSGGRRGYGPTHSQSPENLMVSIPGLTVVFPSHRHEVGRLLERAVLNWNHPVVFFEHKLLYGVTEDPAGYQIAPASPQDPGASVFPTLMKREVSPDLTVVTYGGTLRIAERVAELLAEEDLVVELIVPSLLQPLPRHTLVDLLKNREHVAIVEESPLGPGFGSELAATLIESGFGGRVTRFAPPPVPIPAARSLESSILPDESQLFEAMVAFLTSSDRD